jgi:hypothetical protein
VSPGESRKELNPCTSSDLSISLSLFLIRPESDSSSSRPPRVRSTLLPLSLKVSTTSLTRSTRGCRTYQVCTAQTSEILGRLLVSELDSKKLPRATLTEVSVSHSSLSSRSSAADSLLFSSSAYDGIVGLVQKPYEGGKTDVSLTIVKAQYRSPSTDAFDSARHIRELWEVSSLFLNILVPIVTFDLSSLSLSISSPPPSSQRCRNRFNGFRREAVCWTSRRGE